MRAEQPVPLRDALTEPGVWWVIKKIPSGPGFAPLKIAVLELEDRHSHLISAEIADNTAETIYRYDGYINDWIAYRNYWFAWAETQRRNAEYERRNAVHSRV